MTMSNLTRRGFMTTSGAAIGAPAALAQAVRPRNARLKITDVRTVRLRTIKESGTLEPAWAPGSRMSFRQGGDVLVEIATDEGLTGIGPVTNTTNPVAAKAALAGKDPFDIDFPGAGGPGVDIAVWDLIGKVCGQPLYKLFRAAKDKVPAYASMVQLSNAGDRARLAAQLASEGWRAIKLRLHHGTLKEDIVTVEAVRQATRVRMEIMVDANQAQSAGNWQPGPLWDFRRALETARELERMNCIWLEEPLPRYHFDQIAELNRQVAIPLAGGENNRGVHEYLWMLQQGVYDILQPEVANSGVSDLRKIGVLADAFGRKVVPHHGGSALGIVAHLHLIGSWPHSPWIELLHDPPVCDYRDRFAIFQDPPVLDKEGYLALPQKPGLGVEIREDLVIKG
jgi:L-alanine-DL-glutamate epimerase-like enolase superfamily enzyme